MGIGSGGEAAGEAAYLRDHMGLTKICIIQIKLAVEPLASTHTRIKLILKYTHADCSAFHHGMSPFMNKISSSSKANAIRPGQIEQLLIITRN